MLYGSYAPCVPTQDARTGPSVPGSFAALLRSLREARGLTQEELAERAGLTTYGVSALERGARTRPYPHTVRADADQLRSDVASLRSGSPRGPVAE